MEFINNFFKLKENNTNIKTEVIAGITTFLTMAYIIVVNPSILSNVDGLTFTAVLTGTVIVSAITSILMGLYANLPYALAPGMGINALFTFSLCIGQGVEWQTALGVVFISGIVFIILSVTKLRTAIARAVPESLRYAVAAGIGLFLTFIGFQSVGFIVDNPATLVGFGGMNAQTLLFVIGLIFTSFLLIKKIKGHLLIGIVVMSIITAIVSAIGVSTGLFENAIVKMPESVFQMPSFEIFFKLDIVKALSFAMIGPIFTFVFTDMFDSISTFIGVANTAGLLDENKEPKNIQKAMVVDAVGTTISGLFGTSSATTYIESTSGVEEGGRTGLTAVVTGLLFLPFMFFAPLLSFIPAVATAPILVILGVFMMKPLMNLDWKNYEESIPAFVALILIPLTYSITQGILWGFIIYTAIKLLTGKFKDVSITLYIIDIIAIIGLAMGYLH